MFPPNILDQTPKSKNTKNQHSPNATECDTRMKCTYPQRHAIFRHLNFKKCSDTVSFLTFSLPNMLFATRARHFSTSELQKVLRHRQFFNIFTSECAFRHSGVQFFDIRTSKKCSEDYSFSTCSLPNVLFATAALQKVFQRLQFFNIVTSKSAPQFSTSELQKVLRGLQFFNIFTSECAFRHSGVQFFDIRTSKSSPKTTVFQHFHFVLFATAACNFSTSELQKVLRHRQFFNIFTSECAFRHSGVQFFDIRTSKSAPKTTVFQHFHIQMCFSPQRHAIFQHQNFKKCSDTVSFSTFSHPNVLFATAACNFSTSELQKVFRHRQFLSIFTSKCAFHHSGVQFLMSPLSTYLRTRPFNRPTFRLTLHTDHWKNAAFRDFSNIWRGCIFFLLTFALLHLLSADLTTLLCFSTVHIVGSFYLNFLR